MRYTAALQAVDRTGRAGSDDDFVGQGSQVEWQLEELTEVRETPGSRSSNRWLGVLIAVAVGIVGFGFAGHFTSPQLPETTATSCLPVTAIARSRVVESEPAPFALTTPTTGTEVRAGVVKVSGIARRGLGTLHLAVVMGDAVLGWTNLDVLGPGPVSASIRVFAPSFEAPAVLRIDNGPSRYGTGFSSITAIRLRTPTGVTLWRISPVGSSTTRALRVEGYGPETIAGVEVRLTTDDGRVIDSAMAPIAYDDGRPGSVGGEMIGLGSFTVRLDLDGPLPTEPLVLRLRWRSGADDSVHEIRETVDLTKPRLAPDRRSSWDRSEGQWPR